MDAKAAQLSGQLLVVAIGSHVCQARVMNPQARPLSVCLQNPQTSASQVDRVRDVWPGNLDDQDLWPEPWSPKRILEVLGVYGHPAKTLTWFAAREMPRLSLFDDNRCDKKQVSGSWLTSRGEMHSSQGKHGTGPLPAASRLPA